MVITGRSGLFGLLALAGLVAPACGGPRFQVLPPPAIAATVTNRGDVVYVGRVFPLHGTSAQPTYVYQRRVEEQQGRLVSTHVTRDLGGAIQLAESASHSSDYVLSEYTLYANQLGQSGGIRVQDHQATFRITDGNKNERVHVERLTGDVVVGPTLVGYIFRRLDGLTRGEIAKVRLAVLDRMETIGFDLAAVPAPAGQTRIQMTPSSFLIRLAVDPVLFTFETSTRKLVRLEGRVPTKVRAGDRWNDFDARVEYDFVAASYR